MSDTVGTTDLKQNKTQKKKKKKREKLKILTFGQPSPLNLLDQQYERQERRGEREHQGKESNTKGKFWHFTVRLSRQHLRFTIVGL